MPKTTLITGATGMIGKHIAEAITARGDEFTAMTTNAVSAAKLLPRAKKIVELSEYLSLRDDKIDAVINLAGANLGSKRWNDKTKKEFYDSRIETTAKLVDLISQMPVKPDVLVSSSGVDYYGDCGSRDVYEDSPRADSYLGKLTGDWEQEALKAENYGVRVAVLRTGFVMAKDSEAVDKLLMPYKLFVGGPLGGGKQYVSWIHIDDLVRIYLFAIDNPGIRGIYNAASPNPEMMKEFGKAAAKVLHRPAIFPVPGFVVKIIAGEMAAVVLEGRRALPNKLIDAGYKFKFIRAEDAWKDVLRK
ncbi:MAG: TIGR01777 family oxidoreductase [Ignavibacteria bacterium]|nr:TIGR01777 family oxidoreductase [Ignavibacteria bacterium]